MNRWTDAELQAYLAKNKKFEVTETIEPDETPDPGRENILQGKCEDWLDARGFPFIHDRSRRKNKKGKILDLHIYLPAGRHVVIELKSETGIMKPEQIETYRKILFLGHEIYKARSFKRFLELMNEQNNYQKPGHKAEEN